MAGIYIPGLAILVLSAAVFWTAGASSGAPTLTTTLGDVTGSSRELFLQTLETFYGIPFAKPPVGDRRFSAPEAADAWGAPRDGTIKPRACWQAIKNTFDRYEGVAAMWDPNTERDEDCLYLNVWRRAPEAGDSPKTIMVWIYGGGFWSGSATLDVYDGSDLAARKNVIVVTIAYRLGPLGFMYLENNAEVPGNAGLLDQVMALQWVKDNAVNLGGSPDDITIFGQGSGAASVGFHMLSPLSRNLFNNAIMQSGSPTAYWAVTDTQKAASKVARLAASVSCPVSLGVGLLPCLRGVDAQALTVQQWNVIDKWFEVPFGPIVDGNFLPSDPENMLKTGNVKMTNLLTGVTLNDGIVAAVIGFREAFDFDRKGELPDTDVFRNIILTIADNNSTLQTELLELYSQEFNDANLRRLRIVDAASGDALYKCPVIDFVRQYTELGGQVYLYSFEEKYSSIPFPGWMGIPHRSEIEVVFGRPLNPGYTDVQEEKDLTKEIMEFWTSFAKTGTPEYMDVEWPMYTTRFQDYVKIRSKGTRVARRLRKDVCDVWTTHSWAPSPPSP